MLRKKKQQQFTYYKILSVLLPFHKSSRDKSFKEEEKNNDDNEDDTRIEQTLNINFESKPISSTASEQKKRTNIHTEHMDKEANVLAH